MIPVFIEQADAKSKSLIWEEPIETLIELEEQQGAAAVDNFFAQIEPLMTKQKPKRMNFRPTNLYDNVAYQFKADPAFHC